MADKAIDLTTDYVVVHAILGVQHLRTCSVVAVVTSAEEAAIFNGEPIYKVNKTAVLSAEGKAPTDAGDARFVAAALATNLVSPLPSSGPIFPAELVATPPAQHNNCRLYKLFSQAMDPLSGAAGLYFSYTNNITTTVQQHLDMDHNQPLWKRSVEEVWWNGAISAPLRGMNRSIPSQSSQTKSKLYHITHWTASASCGWQKHQPVNLLHDLQMQSLCSERRHLCMRSCTHIHDYSATLTPSGSLAAHAVTPIATHIHTA